jgi:hypothetical protein
VCVCVCVCVCVWRGAGAGRAIVDCGSEEPHSLAFLFFSHLHNFHHPPPHQTPYIPTYTIPAPSQLERQRDFQYHWAKTTDSQDAYGLPGHVHSGFFAVFKAVRTRGAGGRHGHAKRKSKITNRTALTRTRPYNTHTQLAGPLVEEEISKQRPNRLTFAGHSLGGAVGALLAYHAASKFPSMGVELISFGAPNVGDAAFSQAFDGKVKNRHLTFTVCVRSYVFWFFTFSLPQHCLTRPLFSSLPPPPPPPLSPNRARARTAPPTTSVTGSRSRRAAPSTPALS